MRMARPPLPVASIYCMKASTWVASMARPQAVWGRNQRNLQ